MRVLPFSRPTTNQDVWFKTTASSFFRYTSGGALLATLLLTSSCMQEQDASASALQQKPATATTLPANAAPDTAALDAASTAPAPEALTPAATAPAEWTYPGPKPLPGAVLPGKRIVAFYGNLLSKRMGILGELEPEQMLAKLDEEVVNWSKADSLTPVQPALHLIAVTAQGHPSAGGKYRLRMKHDLIDQVLELAKQRDAIVFLDVQVGQSTLQEELPQLEKYLKLPNVHLGIDAEFAMKDGKVPGRSIGTFDAADINYATDYLARLVQEHGIPPKLLIVHRFTQRMITNYENIKLRPETQVVMHMDGWGSPALKKDTYRRFIVREPVQFTGFKLFYKNDLRNSPRMMTPEEIIALSPSPMYIQYQ
ncbi:hypothetical protein [Pontibacter litorisediminis]|uniref:hypothetical protein n=1 Tax=Pontibacter litorisediminis TaxID=1846260 RepID=UPI0023ED20C1|nr:hypothetical protein [Pontibacter litorisediminis]